MTITSNYSNVDVRVSRLISDFKNWAKNIKKFIKYSNEVTVFIKPIEQKTTLGRVNYIEKTIEIDPRFTLIQLRKTLIHELVHYEQYRDNRLQIKNNIWLWEGKQYDNTLNYESYKELPWEREARKRTKKIVNKLFNIY